MYGVGKNLAGMGQKTDVNYNDAVSNAEALLAVCKELEKRHYESGI